MKKMLLLVAAISVLALSACGPLLGVAQQDSATLTTDGVSVLFANPYPTPAQEVVVVLYGPATVTGAACAPFSKSWVCPVGDVLTGKGYRLAYTGKLNNASASFYRTGSGDRPIYIPLK